MATHKFFGGEFLCYGEKKKEKCIFCFLNVVKKIIAKILETFAKVSKAQNCGKKETWDLNTKRKYSFYIINKCAHLKIWCSQQASLRLSPS
jgi:hypothetical protein